MSIEIGSWDLPRPEGAPPEPARKVYASPATELATEKVDWLWPGRFAMGKLSLLVGHSGTGKSQVALAMAAAVSSGGAWPCGEGRAAPGNVLILSTEDAKPDTVKPRLAAAGADLGRVYFVSEVMDEQYGRRSVSLTYDLDLLDLTIERVGDVRLVILDPVTSYLAGAPSSNAATRSSVLDPIARMACRRQAAVLGTSHFGRSLGPRALDRVIGAVAFPAAARAVSMVVADPDDDERRLLVEIKNNLGPATSALRFRIEEVALPNEVSASTVRWEDEPVSISADEAIMAATRAEERWTKDAAADFLRTVLAKGAVAVEQIELQACDAGLLEEDQYICASKPFRMARHMLGIRTRRLSGPQDEGRGNWAWVLPDAASPPAPRPVRASRARRATS